MSEDAGQLFALPRTEKLDCLSHEALLELLKTYQAGYAHAVSVNGRLARENEDLRQRLQISGTQSLLLEEKLILIRHRVFDRSSERTKSHPEPVKKRRAQFKPQLPSVRFPDAEIIESRFDFETPPNCGCCQDVMVPMNCQETSEEIDVVPRKFFIRRLIREKYRCKGCQSQIVTAPGPVKLVSGGSYSAAFATEVAEQKYSHHVPIERLRKQFSGQGLAGIESPTLIEQTHHLAERLRGVYRAIKAEIQAQPLLHADETTWRMLEGSEKKNWYLWGYGCERGVFYQAKDGRTSETPGHFLRESKAKFLMVDGYTGYTKAAREERLTIQIAHCWAHARRKFLEAEKTDPRAATAVRLIDAIYHQEKGTSLAERKQIRSKQGDATVAELRSWAMAQTALPKSSLGKAIAYLFRYWEGLTLFLKHAEVPLDNNFAERALRGPVLGRKNFYGNHSIRGAETSAILYTVSETCKLISIPFSEFVCAALRSPTNLTPYQYAQT